MPYGQNQSRCRPDNAVSTALLFITRNLLTLCCESRYISDALTYQLDIYSLLQCHPTFTLLYNVILISATFLYRLSLSTRLHFASTYSSPHYATFITHVPNNNPTRVLCLLIANNLCYLQAITSPPGLSTIKSCPIAPLLRHHNSIPHSLHQHDSITIFYLISSPITTSHCPFIPYPHPPVPYPA